MRIINTYIKFSIVHLSSGMRSMEPDLHSGVKSLWLVDCFQHSEASDSVRV